MQERSLRWMALNAQKKKTTNQDERNAISKEQAMLHAQNVADSKKIGARYERKTGEWTRTAGRGDNRHTESINGMRATVGDPRKLMQNSLPFQLGQQTGKVLYQGRNPKATLSDEDRAILHAMPTGQNAFQAFNQGTLGMQQPTGPVGGVKATRRLADAGASIGYKLEGMIPALFETGQQRTKNVAQERAQDGFTDLEAKQKQLQDALAVTPVSDSTGKLTDTYKALQAQLDEVNAQIERMSVNTPVDQSLFGQTKMRESREKAAAATVGMTGTEKFLADTGLSIANNAVTLPTALIHPALPLVIMGTEAAADKTTELNERGVEPGEALARGLVSGGIEAATEKLPLENLLNTFATGAGKSVIRNLLKQSGTEAGEEAVSYVLNYIADKAVQDPEAQFSLAEMVQAAAGGAVSGGIMGGGALLGNYTMNRLGNNIESDLPTQPTMQERIQNEINDPESAVVDAQFDPEDIAPPVQPTAPQTVPEATVQETPIVQQETAPQVMQTQGANTVQNVQEPSVQAQTTEGAPVVGSNPEVRTMNQTDSYDVTGYTLSQDAIDLADELKQIGDVKTAVETLLPKYEALHDRALQDATDYVTGYKGRGVLVLPTGEDATGRGVRVNQNEPWYREFYQKYGRAPRKAEAAAVAEQLLQQDRNGAQFGFDADARRMYDALTELHDRVLDRDGLTGFTRNENGDVQAVYDMPVDQVGKVEATESTGAAPAGFDPYSRAVNEYGAIEPGENPARVVDVPKSTDGETRVNRGARTILETAYTTDATRESIEKSITDTGIFSHGIATDKKAMKQATRVIRDKGFDGALRQWQDVTNGYQKADKNNLAMAIALYAASEKAGDTQLSTRLAAEIAAQGTLAGQEVQAMRLLKKTTPEGQLYYMRKIVQGLNEKYEKRLQKKAKQNGLSDIQNFAEEHGITLDESLARELVNTTDADARDEIIDRMCRNIAEQIPGSWTQKADAIRYFSMLGRPTTHIRNIASNFMMQLPVSTKNKIGAVLEKAFLEEADRTKSLTQADKATRDFAKADAERMKNVLQGGGNYSIEQMVRQYMQPFSNKHLLGKMLNKGSSLNSAALELEDWIALGPQYRRALEGFIKARGLDVNTLIDENGNASAALEEARSYAIREAQKATFRDDSQIAAALNKFEKTSFLTRVLVGGEMPFKKTPINIVKRGIEYSPAGFLKAAKEFRDVRMGTKTMSEAIDTLASAITGTGLMAVGAALGSAGILHGAGSGDKKEQNLNSASGIQEYSIDLGALMNAIADAGEAIGLNMENFRVDENGGYTYTLDWTAPGSLPLFMGVEVYNAIWGDKADDSDAGAIAKFCEALLNITEPMFSMTMLNGIRSTLKSASYDDANPLTAALTSIVSSYAGQFVPSVLGSVARTIDDTRRTTYKNKSYTGEPTLDLFLQKQQNKIPGLSKKNIPYMDVFGNTDTEPNTALRVFENFLSPGYLQKKENSEAISGLRDLYRETGDASVLPNKAATSFSVDGKTKNLTQDEYQTFAQTRGKMIEDGLADLFRSSAYQNMGSEERVNAVSELYKHANAAAKAKISDYPMSDAQKRAADSGVPLGTYYAYKQTLDNLNAAKDEDARIKTAQQIADDSSLTQNEKNTLMLDILLSSDDSIAKYHETFESEFDPQTYITLLNEKSKINKMYNDEDDSESKKEGAWVKYLKASDLTDAQKAKAEEEMKFYRQMPATAYIDSFEMLEEYGGKQERAAAQEMQDAGVTLDMHNTAKEYKSSLTGTGKGQKERVIQWMRAQGWTEAQIEAEKKALYGESSGGSGSSSGGSSSGKSKNSKGGTGVKTPKIGIGLKLP